MCQIYHKNIGYATTEKNSIVFEEKIIKNLSCFVKLFRRDEKFLVPTRTKKTPDYQSVILS
jgi:hypothetical protein